MCRYLWEGEKFDPRAEFLACLQEQLSTDPLVLSCRITDYEQVGRKLDLPGAITLLPLSKDKIKEFLLDKQEQPQLWSALENDSNLLDLARTPLLLALLSSAIGESKEAVNLNSAGDLIDFYTERRYEHEAAKHSVPFTLEETKRYLSIIAARMWRDYWKPQRSLTVSEVQSVLGDQATSFLAFARILQLLAVSPDQATIEFPHLAFRDHFAVFALIQALGDEEEYVRFSAAYTLSEIGSAAVPALIQALGDEESYVRASAASALSKIDHQVAAAAAVPILQQMLTDASGWVRDEAAEALERIQNPSITGNETGP